MKTPASLNQLLQKPMDRKEFLQHTAAITLFLAGGGILAQSLLKGLKFGQSTPVSSMGYGASAYGGAVSINSKQ